MLYLFYKKYKSSSVLENHNANWLILIQHVVCIHWINICIYTYTSTTEVWSPSTSKPCAFAFTYIFVYVFFPFYFWWTLHGDRRTLHGDRLSLHGDRWTLHGERVERLTFQHPVQVETYFRWIASKAWICLIVSFLHGWANFPISLV